MEQQKGLVRSSMNLPGFVENAYQSVEAMKQFANLLLESKLCPDHFYEKLPDGKVDYTKGNDAAVMMVLLQGHQLMLPPMTALQHIIPINGLLSIKGDAAKSLIFNSGKLRKDTWKEEATGSIANGDYQVTITATRDDNGQTLSRSFSVARAKRAGLWIDEAKIRGQDGWKYQKSAWYKHPERMIGYRALGFLSRDLFPDVMAGIYTTEEALDMPQDTTTVIETEKGTTIQIPDKQFSQERSETITGKAAEKIDKVNQRDEVVKPPDEIAQHPVTPDEAHPGLKISDKDEPPARPPEEEPDPREGVTVIDEKGVERIIPRYTEDQMKEMPVEELNDIINHDHLMRKAREIDPGKNTNKKLRTIILTHYQGAVQDLITQFEPEGPPEEQKPSEGPKNDQEKVETTTGSPGESETSQPETETESPGSLSEGLPDGEPGSGPEQEEPPVEDRVDANKFNIDVPATEDGKRAFDQVKSLFEDMSNIAGVDNKIYEQLITTKFPEFQKYRTKEDFCYKAEVQEINRLLNSIE